MDAFLIMLRSIAIFVALAVPGYLLVKKGTLPADSSGILTTVLVKAGLPFLVISNMLKANIGPETARNMLLTALVYLTVLLLLYRCGGILLGKRTEQSTRVVERGAVTFPNGAFFGLPLCITVFGSASDVTTYTIVTSVLCLLLLNSLGIYMMSGDRSTVSVKGILTNPVLIAVVIGLGFNLLGIGRRLPEIADFSGYLGGLVTPLSMVILGMKLAAVRFGEILGSRRGYLISALRLLLSPVLGVGLALLLRLVLPVPDEAVLALFFSVSMPTATRVTAFADRFRQDTRAAVIDTLLSTLLSVVTIPLLYMGLTAILR